jgi:TolB protein
MRFLSVFALLILLFATPAFADLQVDITRGVAEPIPVAITDLYGASADDAQLGKDISAVVSADLERSGLFRPIAPSAFIQDPASLQQGAPRFADWRLINAQGLISGTVKDEGGGRKRVEFRLWDIFAGQQIAGFAFTTTTDNWRRIAHKIADVIYNRITGESGYFDTRVVYIAESGPQTRRIKRLAIMDQDGQNHRFLTDGRELVLTPRFSPSTQKITFMAYRNNRPRVYILDLQTGAQQILGDFKGMTFAPRFSPNGNSVIFSLSQNGNSNIYAMDVGSRRTQQLTNHPSINTGGSYSPDGSKIVFESDRGDKQQLYVMNADGSNQTRITFGQGRYGNPVWSPRGDLIAFTRLYGGNFYVGVIRPDGSGERLLSQGYHVEGPTWAPNGRVLMFFKEGRGAEGKSQLYSIDLTGQNERIVSTPVGASDPAWSPLLP